jgi:hypothetical protein
MAGCPVHEVTWPAGLGRSHAVYFAHPMFTSPVLNAGANVLHGWIILDKPSGHVRDMVLFEILKDEYDF